MTNVAQKGTPVQIFLQITILLKWTLPCLAIDINFLMPLQTRIDVPSRIGIDFWCENCDSNDDDDDVICDETLLFDIKTNYSLSFVVSIQLDVCPPLSLFSFFHSNLKVTTTTFEMWLPQFIMIIVVDNIHLNETCQNLFSDRLAKKVKLLSSLFKL